MVNVALGGSLDERATFEHPQYLWVQNIQKYLITTVKFECVLTTQTALIDWKNIIHRFRHFPKILGQKVKDQPPKRHHWYHSKTCNLLLRFLFSDKELQAFTRYEYAVVAVNGAGSGMSDHSTATTHESEPEGVLPVTTVVEPNRLDTIFLSWRPPLKPNGTADTKISLFVR